MTAATVRAHSELIQILEAIQASTEAVAGMPDSPAVARWLDYRADMYERIAAEHPSDSELPAELAQGAARLDRERAARIQQTRTVSNAGTRSTCPERVAAG